MKKPIISLLLAASLLSLSLTGCAEENREYAQNVAAVKKGEEAAQKYIKDKYGFDAEIISSGISVIGKHDEYYYAGSPDPRSIFLEMSHNGQKFNVFVYTGEDSPVAFDDYQQDEITQGFADYFTETTGVEVSEIELRYGEFYNYQTSKEKDDCLCLMDTYFDGSNMQEVIDSFGGGMCCIKAVNQDLSCIETYELKGRYNMDHLAIANCISEDDLSKVDMKDLRSSETYHFDSIALNLKDYIVSTARSSCYVEFTPHELEGMTIITTGGDDLSLEKTTLDISKTDEGRSYEKAEILTQAYSLTADVGKVYIIIPAKDLNVNRRKGALGFLDDDVLVVVQYVQDGKIKTKGLYDFLNDENYITGDFEITGDMSDIKFAVFKK